MPRGKVLGATGKTAWDGKKGRELGCGIVDCVRRKASAAALAEGENKTADEDDEEKTGPLLLLLPAAKEEVKGAGGNGMNVGNAVETPPGAIEVDRAAEEGTTAGNGAELP